MRRHKSISALNALLMHGLVSALMVGAASAQEASLEALSRRAAVLEREVTLLEDHNAVERLQRIYGFYTDKQMWTQAADLFANFRLVDISEQP